MLTTLLTRHANANLKDVAEEEEEEEDGAEEKADDDEEYTAPEPDTSQTKKRRIEDVNTEESVGGPNITKDDDSAAKRTRV